jgi:CHASE2 domain-containing sensor protein
MKVLYRISGRVWVIVVFFLLTALLSGTRLLSSYEHPFYDILLRTRPAAVISNEIVLITYSDATLKHLPQWPLPRYFHADLINVLREIGVKAIVFDMGFPEPTLYDEALIESVYEAKNVYFSSAYLIDQRPVESHKPLIGSEPILDNQEDFKPYLKGVGHINTLPEIDGKVRKIPLFIEYDSQFIPHLGLMVAADSLGLDIKRVEFKKRGLVIDGRLVLPVGENTSFLVNYPGAWHNSFKVIDYLQLMQSYLNDKKGREASFDIASLKDKICFVGVTATAGHDYGPTPLEPLSPRMAIHGCVYNSILTRNFISDVPVYGKTLINILLALLVVIVCFKNKPLQSLVAGIILGGLYLALAWFIFARFGLYLDVFLPLAIVAAGWAAITLYNFLEQTRKKDLLEKELDIAQQIQESFLPADIGTVEGLDISYFMKPAKFVAGDLYDVIQLDERRIGVFIGDVSGKGVPASLIMAQTISLFRVFAKQSNDPAKVLSDLNHELSKVLSGRFVTALYLIFDSRENILQAASAGHNPIMSYGTEKNSVQEYLPSSGLPLGVMEDSPYETFQCPTVKGDKFVLYTDGITEARDKKGDEFGETRLKDLLLKDKALSSSQIIESLKSQLFRFTQGMPQFDDITLIVLAVVE